jgi:hypothetical protein
VKRALLPDPSKTNEINEMNLAKLGQMAGLYKLTVGEQTSAADYVATCSGNLDSFMNAYFGPNVTAERQKAGIQDYLTGGRRSPQSSR